ncbi:Non-specific serine/threonine protein kinase [Heracleum sosnowskyi]|uniref:non-specific serine/threonine protein kinase n=1 Tax=Heracleum sosnowskyi TaxID=360622 RepID=A0AAD8LY04_9APIA|nr:Non-specific serine/threonine protein kinase [Heracleum sosnowskyi]
MLAKLAFLLILLVYSLVSADQEFGFIFNGFQSKNISLDGVANLTSNGLLKLTNSVNQIGQAFYSNQINFKNKYSSKNSNITPSVSSFSTTFVFAIVPEFPRLSAHGIVFVITPTKNLSKAPPYEYFGVFNSTNNGNPTNHIFAVELDTIQNNQFGDINFDHVGIDINGLNSTISLSAGYFDDTNEFQNLTLFSGQKMQLWVEYSGLGKQINVTLAPVGIGKPKKPLLSLHYDLDPVLNEEMYVGFSSTTGTIVFTSHYVLGWSFMMNGMAKKLDLSKLPTLPRIGPKKKSSFLTIGLPLILAVTILLTFSGVFYYARRKKKFSEVLEDWELEYGPHRFKYKDLYVATKGFDDKELLGIGGFGRVYRGVLPISKIEVAVKRVSHESRQGMREFVAEIVSIGRLRHRNIVQLLGYCRRRGELLLVYDYMPNGSLDRFLHNSPNIMLKWSQRFRVIKGVAAGLKYLHQDWDQVVIHRDVKASNVLLDIEMNGRLGDFGLARLYDHGTDTQTTHVVGTIGYLAPEHARTGKATTSTDVYSFGAFLLEVVCGRRPIDVRQDILLVNQVCSLWNKGEIIQAVDPKLGVDYVVEEVELVLKLGLLCSCVDPNVRPSMQQVVQYLDGYEQLPELSDLSISQTGFTFGDSTILCCRILSH